MKNLILKRVIAVIFVFTLLITTVNPIDAKTTPVIAYNTNGIYSNIPIESIYVDGAYYGIAIVQSSDQTYNSGAIGGTIMGLDLSALSLNPLCSLGFSYTSFPITRLGNSFCTIQRVEKNSRINLGIVNG